MYLVVTQVSEEVAPFKVTSSLITSSLKNRCIETWHVFVFVLAINSLMLALASILALFALFLVCFFVTLAHHGVNVDAVVCQGIYQVRVSKKPTQYMYVMFNTSQSHFDGTFHVVVHFSPLCPSRHPLSPS